MNIAIRLNNKHLRNSTKDLYQGVKTLTEKKIRPANDTVKDGKRNYTDVTDIGK